MAVDAFSQEDLEIARRIEPLEETIDTMEDILKTRHIERLKGGDCTVDGGIVFLELLTNLERISDHCSNIAVYVISYQQKRDALNRHEYLKKIHSDRAEDYRRMFEGYQREYLSRIE